MNPSYRDIFEPDEGSLLQVMVFDTASQDWQCMLQILQTKYVTVYSEDGTVTNLPPIDQIWLTRLQKSLTFEILLPGFTVNTHFFTPEEIELNILPDDIDSQEKANAFFEFMLLMADTLGRNVYLAPEHGSASSEELRKMAICVAEPGRPAIHFLNT